jgi:hypothetical protein
MWYVTITRRFPNLHTNNFTDAYTYLGLNSSNKYNIQASLYNSGDFLKVKGKETNGKVDGYFYKKKRTQETGNLWSTNDCFLDTHLHR